MNPFSKENRCKLGLTALLCWRLRRPLLPKWRLTNPETSWPEFDKSNGGVSAETIIKFRGRVYRVRATKEIDGEALLANMLAFGLFAVFFTEVQTYFALHRQARDPRTGAIGYNYLATFTSHQGFMRAMAVRTMKRA